MRLGEDCRFCRGEWDVLNPEPVKVDGVWVHMRVRWKNPYSIPCEAGGKP